MGYKQGLDNGVLKNPKDLSGKSSTPEYECFADLVANGENPKGFTAYTPNGVSRMPKDTLVHEDNFGRFEDGAHRDDIFMSAPSLPRTPRRK